MTLGVLVPSPDRQSIKIHERGGANISWDMLAHNLAVCLNWQKLDVTVTTHT